MANAGAQHEFPPIPMESWREQAECARIDPATALPVYDATLWDAPVGKPKKDDKNAVRAAKAKRICNTLCDVRAECSAGPGADLTAESGLGLPHTYVRTDGDELVNLRESVTGRIARDGRKPLAQLIQIDELAARRAAGQ